MSVRIYARPAGRGRDARFEVADYSTGRRKWRTFLDLRAAKAEALRIANLLRVGDTVAASMGADERRDFARATESVAPFGVDVPTAAALFAEAAKLVGTHNVVTACREFARRSPASREALPLSTAADAYFLAKESKGRSKRLLQDVRSRVGRFVAEHPGKALSDFTTADVQAWLDKLKREDGKPVSPVTRRNFATVLGGLFEHYRRRGNLSENPVRDVERDSGRNGAEVEFWTPDEAKRLLAAVPDVAKAALVVGLFCGCRTAEITRLRWGAIDFAAGHIEIGSSIAKTQSRRLIPLCPAAVAWLAPLRGRPEDPIYGEHATNLPKRVSEAAEAAGVRRIPNGARHSYITFRVAETGDVARVALEAGNSPSMIFGHYRGLATAEQAKEYFALRPSDPAKEAAR